MATIGADLVRQMAAGDREAFAVFYDRYAPVVFPLILRIVRERADASDVLQEVFWEAWRDAPAYDANRGSAEAWMVMVLAGNDEAHPLPISEEVAKLLPKCEFIREWKQGQPLAEAKVRIREFLAKHTPAG